MTSETRKKIILKIYNEEKLTLIEEELIMKEVEKQRRHKGLTQQECYDYIRNNFGSHLKVQYRNKDLVIDYDN